MWQAARRSTPTVGSVRRRTVHARAIDRKEADRAVGREQWAHENGAVGERAQPHDGGTARGMHPDERTLAAAMKRTLDAMASGGISRWFNGDIVRTIDITQHARVDGQQKLKYRDIARAYMTANVPA